MKLIVDIFKYFALVAFVLLIGAYILDEKMQSSREKEMQDSRQKINISDISLTNLSISFGSQSGNILDSATISTESGRLHRAPFSLNARLTNLSEMHTLSEVGFEVTAKQCSAVKQCFILGIENISIKTTIPPRQTRDITGSIILQNIQNSNNIEWTYRVTYLSAL